MSVRQNTTRFFDQWLEIYTSPAVPAYHHGTTAVGNGTYDSEIPFTLQGPKVNATLSYETTRDVLYSRENILSSDTLSKFTYTVNSIGQRKAVATTGTAFNGTPADWSWDYDSLGQVTNANFLTDANNRTYSYDTIGNRITATANTSPHKTTTSYFGNSANTPGANALNQYAKITYPGPTTISPQHDDDGNMTSGPVPGSAGMSPGMPTPANATLQWDAENRLVKATVGSSVITYDYDFLSRLVRRTDGNGSTVTAVTQYLYDGWNRIAEYNVTTSGTSTTYSLAKTYLWGLDLSGSTQGAGGVGGLLSIVDVGAGNRYYPTYDGNGNVSEYVDNQTGAKVAHFEYDPFGNLTKDTNNNAAIFPYRFSTKPQDSVTGLLNYCYRWFSPLDGRWLSRDPMEGIGGINLYGFVENDVLGRIDILGFSSLIVFYSSAVNENGDPDGPNLSFGASFKDIAETTRESLGLDKDTDVTLVPYKNQDELDKAVRNIEEKSSDDVALLDHAGDGKIFAGRDSKHKLVELKNELLKKIARRARKHLFLGGCEIGSTNESVLELSEVSADAGIDIIFNRKQTDTRDYQGFRMPKLGAKPEKVGPKKYHINIDAESDWNYIDKNRKMHRWEKTKSYEWGKGFILSADC